MLISDIELNGSIWNIKGQLDCDEKNDFLFWGECDGIPIIVELTDYTTIENGKDINISIPLEAFDNIKVEGKFWLEFCGNFNKKNSILVDPKIIGYKSKLQVSGNYNYEFIINEKSIFIAVEPKCKVFKALRIEIDNHMIGIELENMDELYEDTASLYLKKRLTEKLWRFNDREFLVGNVAKNGVIGGTIPFEYFEEENDIEYYDFVLKVKHKNTIAEYLLYFTEDFVQGKVICSDRYEDNAKQKNIDIYFSTGKNLSLKCYCEKKFESKVQSITIQNGKVKILLSEIEYKDDFADEKKLVIKKRTYNNEKLYCFTWEKELESYEGKYIFEEYANQLLKCGVKKCDEYWDVFIKSGSEEFPVLCDKSVKTEYFDAAGNFKICFFGNLEGRLSVYTHEGDYKKNEKTNIAVLGTCFSRSVFKSLPYFNPDYKKYYDCVYTQYHSSIISLTSQKIENWTKKDLWGVEAARYMPTEFNKDFFEKLKESKAEYLLIDNYVDATRPIIEVGNGMYITYNKYLIKSNMIRDYAKCRFIKPGTLEYYELYKKHAKIFVNKIKECIPEDHILLLEGRFAYSKIDERTNLIEEWGGKPYIQKNNIVWDNVDNCLLSIAPDIRVIDMRCTKYLSDANSPIPGGASPSHYQKYFYKEILDKINKVILEDKVKEK